MDLTTIIGIVLGTVLIVNGIGIAKLGNFFDMPSILIVVGGTFAAIIASYPLSILKDMPKHFMVLLRGKQYNIPKLVDQLVDLAMVARQSGLLALEEKAEEIKRTAAVIYKALDCSGFARVDMFLSDSGEIVFNEVNTIPGFTAHSRFPNMMKAAGVSFGQILSAAIEKAVGA